MFEFGAAIDCLWFKQLLRCT
uniref:Uncharacterized protein n=1 Tax=Arundo donax TaxID=35708 RepID=A0A0A9EXS7_ARUDO